MKLLLFLKDKITKHIQGQYILMISDLDDVDRIIVNNEDYFNKMIKLFSVISPSSKQKFNLL